MIAQLLIDAIKFVVYRNIPYGMHPHTYIHTYIHNNIGLHMLYSIVMKTKSRLTLVNLGGGGGEGI